MKRGSGVVVWCGVATGGHKRRFCIFLFSCSFFPFLMFLWDFGVWRLRNRQTPITMIVELIVRNARDHAETLSNCRRPGGKRELQDA